MTAKHGGFKSPRRSNTRGLSEFLKDLMET